MSRPRKPTPEIPGYWKDALPQRTVVRPGIPAPAKGPQSAGKRTRRRNVVARYLLVSVFFGVLGVVVWMAFESPATAVTETAAGPFTLDYKTDGVIPEAYIREIVGDGSRMPPIFDVKRRIEAVPQVRDVSVRRLAGDKLQITVGERRPVARLYAALPNGETAIRLVSAEGVIFAPINMGDNKGGDNSLILRNLPEIVASAPKAGQAYDYIDGFRTVADFLDCARERYPQLYRDWQQISLAGYRGRPDAVGAVIRVKPRLNTQEADAAALKEIVFSPIDYAEELRRFMEYDGMNAVRATLRGVDRTKYPSYILDLSMVNTSNPSYHAPDFRLIPVPADPVVKPASSRPR